jgi:peroxiredoxin
MLKQGKIYTRTRVAVVISAIIIATAVTMAGCEKKPAEPPNTEHNYLSSGPVTKVAPKTSLNNVIRAARTWQPAYTYLYGKTAPEFTLKDLDGKEHKLSDYRGKDVMLVFWATWCKYCIPEIPHIIELRNTVSEDKLAILAITHEKAGPVKKFAAAKKMNYTVLLEKGNMPNPFGVIRIYQTSGVPCSFFIKPDGKIKLATSGILSLGDMKAILQAE